MKNLPPESLLLPGSLPGGEAVLRWRRHASARRITLRVDARSGEVVVTLPMRASRGAGMALLARNAEWVASRLAELPLAEPFAAGTTVLIDGAAHVIVHAPGTRRGAWIEDGALLVSGDQAFLPRRVGDFLRQEALRRFAAQTVLKADSVGLKVTRVAVKDTRTRWGSCSASGVVMFCWRLLMAPRHVQDYVVAHEVAHLRHMNHSRAFWDLTDALSPHRDAACAWLKAEGARLLRVG